MSTVTDRVSEVTRAAVFQAFANPLVSNLVRRHGGRFGARRFVAGEALADAISVVARLERRGFRTSVQYVGESVTEPMLADAAADEYVAAADAFAQRGLRGYLSVKPSQIGSDLSFDHAVRNLERVLIAARAAGLSVRVEMEHAPSVEATLRLFERVRADHGNVGIVLQAYLYRSRDDLERLAPLRPDIRFVKGAYREPPDVAFPNKSDVDRNFRDLLFTHLERGGTAAAATHDGRIIEDARAYARAHTIPRDRLKFEMLYGIRVGLAERLLAAGEPIVVYVPYGTHWYQYFVRRLAERPANALFVLRSVLRR